MSLARLATLGAVPVGWMWGEAAGVSPALAGVVAGVIVAELTDARIGGGVE